LLFNKKMTLLCSSPRACDVPCVIGVNLNALPQLAALAHKLPREGSGLRDSPCQDQTGHCYAGGKGQARSWLAPHPQP
jgi:hypothetical protein